MVKASVLLDNLAKELENPDSDFVLASEHNENILNIVTLALVSAASILKTAAKEILPLEPSIEADDLEELSLVASEFDGDEELSKYSDSIDNLLNLVGEKRDLSEDLNNAAQLAEALDNSGDDKLAKIASVLDEILLTIGAPKGSVNNIKSADDAEVEKLRAKYKTPSEELFTVGNEAKQKLTDEYTKEIEDKVKAYKPMEAPLNSRYCPDHAGISVMRIGDSTWQCPLDKKIYNYESGYTLMNGDKIPGSSVQNQTGNLQDHAPEAVSFSTREQKLNDNG